MSSYTCVLLLIMFLLFTVPAGVQQRAGTSGQTAARRERVAREAKETLLEDFSNFPFPDVCEEWKAPDLGDAFRASLRSDVPVLFISGTWMPARR